MLKSSTWGSGDIMVTLADLVTTVEKYGFRVARTRRNPDGTLLVDYLDPRLEKYKEGGPWAYFYSAVIYYPVEGWIDTTTRVLMTRRYREFYLDYCVEDCQFVCRPHIYKLRDGAVILSIHAKFHYYPLQRFKMLLNEYNPRVS